MMTNLKRIGVEKRKRDSDTEPFISPSPLHNLSLIGKCYYEDFAGIVQGTWRKKKVFAQSIEARDRNAENAEDAENTLRDCPNPSPPTPPPKGRGETLRTVPE
jgi:hypothetical protein